MALHVHLQQLQLLRWPILLLLLRAQLGLGLTAAAARHRAAAVAVAALPQVVVAVPSKPGNATVPAPHSPPAVVLGQLGAAGAKATSSISNTSLAMVVCLIAVPTVAALVTFLVVDTSFLRKGAAGPETQPHEVRPMPLAPDRAYATRPSVVRGSISHGSDGTAWSSPIVVAQLTAAAQLQALGPCPPPPPTAIEVPSGASAHERLPPLSASPAGSTTIAKDHFWLTGRSASSNAASGLASAASLVDQRASPLATALLVKSPSGALVHLDGVLSPHPEERSINFINARDGSAILCGSVSETQGASTIRLETKAQGLPVAILDTRHAICPVGCRPLPPEKRHVIVGQPTSEGDMLGIGPTCAWVSRTGDGVFVVRYALGGGCLTVMPRRRGSGFWETAGVGIDRLVDDQGRTIAKSESQSGAREGPELIWVRQGADVALVACVLLAVQKLA
mmetsp:Transcript_24591/g.53687  ORF Transcript_24591/g.53687 Transcript_24591/m.53687 type:complete len:450 (+) Transcript_24591:98-1447(+)